MCISAWLENRKSGTNWWIILIPIPFYCFSIVGNPLVCATGKEPNCHGMTLMPMSMNLNNTEGKLVSFMPCVIFPCTSVLWCILYSHCFDADSTVFASLDALQSGRPKTHKMAIAFGLSLGCLCLIVIGFGLVLWWRHKHNQQAFFDVKGTF